ncbi:SDR family NAD(P)-dependent oxidoreductase [Kineococcus rhizosphaerae]|uniref:3-oxoacyl-[acyl-carrier protein] reductase n=1 Tax=Kineococcus rhizosphaerae TaxID=559628 RepID=A0A2T0QUT3_9ACTN|nr:SDR family oxidoreductase [Kineococcus rhizosphaerae]PRY08932.1 3-oxoacyl-[acyl-carrier protein] reductase [Kineococcus rhizosphaerae]
MTDLKDKTVVITGGGRGLGLEMAVAAAKAGSSLALIGRSARTLDEAAAQLATTAPRLSRHVADVGRPEELDRAFAEIADEHGTVDGLVNNAGIAEEYAFLDTPRESWHRVLDVNLTAAFVTTQLAARLMPSGGSIVNIASVDAYGADGPYASYVVAKTGLLGLTRAAAVELAPLGIRVNSVSPGWTLTDMAAESVDPQMLHRMRTNFRRAPLGRMTTPLEIAGAVNFLLGPHSSGITGEDIVVDGGTRANLFILESVSEPASEASA